MALGVAQVRKLAEQVIDRAYNADVAPYLRTATAMALSWIFAKPYSTTRRDRFQLASTIAALAEVSDQGHAVLDALAGATRMVEVRRTAEGVRQSITRPSRVTEL